MNADNPRVTLIMGAGSVLDMNFPKNIILPSTWKITERVKEPYEDVFNYGRKITVVEDIYQFLVERFPVDTNLWWESNPTPNIHFEILFHVMEQLKAYTSVWEDKNKNPSIYPHFAPFTSQNFEYDSKDLNQVMWSFIMRIMMIVNDYNEYFSKDKGAENWYRDFFKSDFLWDVFNFNYDTTEEQSLGEYEDGFVQMPDRIESKFFPKNLMLNIKNLSTINHIHGCINYYYKDNPINDMFETNIHDLYLYPNFDEVKRRMDGRIQSNQSAQNNEEYFAGPIITGLRKTEKLACVPYDFYHGNLYKTIINSNAMIIAGYSFGDIYVNNLINRMHAIWHGKERIVVIDKWDGNKISGYRTELSKYMQTLSRGEIEFLGLISECNCIEQMIDSFIDTDVNHPKYSNNKCLMLITNGMKEAANIREDIYTFLKS